jgi:uroporphyrinogen-III decarboxylase
MDISNPTFPELSFSELKAARQLIDAEMERRVKDEQQRLLSEIKVKAAEFGFSVEQLFGKPLPTRRKSGRKPKAETPPNVNPEAAAAEAAQTVVGAIAAQLVGQGETPVLSVAT